MNKRSMRITWLRVKLWPSGVNWVAVWANVALLVIVAIGAIAGNLV